MTPSDVTLVYLDTNIISGVVRHDLKPVEQSAVSQILRLYEEGKVKLVTSEQAKNEIERIPAQFRGPHLHMLSTISMLPTVNAAGSNIASCKDPLYALVERTIGDSDDAQHCWWAFRSNVSHALTCDEPLSRHSTAIWQKLRVQLLRPSQLTSVLSRP